MRGQDRAKATIDQMMLMNENEEDLEFQRPRSNSLPNMQFIDFEDQFDYDNSLVQRNSNYVFK